MKPLRILILVILLAAFPAQVQARPSSQAAGPSGAFTPTGCPFHNPSHYAIDCGYVTAPLDHARPPGGAQGDTQGNSIRLAVAIVRSPNPNKAPDPVLYLQGGPGGEMVALAPYLVNQGEISAMLLDRDVILVDQRGMGLSEPAFTCQVFKSGAEALALPAAEINARLAACPAQFEARGIRWQAFTSEQNAADLALVGPALGYEQVNLFGVSYGTLLGLLILRDHPEVVRSAVLDSVLPPDVSPFAESAQLLDRSFARLETDCQADLLCRLAYPNLRQTMIATYQRLEERPAIIEVNGQPVSITAEVFAQFATFLASRQAIEAQPALVTAIAHDDYEVTRVFLQAVQSAGQDDLPNLALFMSMACPYYAAATSPEAISAAFAPYTEPFQKGRFGTNDWLRCQQWGPLPPASPELPRGDLPVLMLSGIYDPGTPPAWAHAAARYLSRATVLEIPYASHHVTAEGGATGECALQLMTAFYADPGGSLQTGCLAKIPAPRFILHTTVTRAPILWATIPLALAAAAGLGGAANAWRKQPRWTAWRAAFRHLGLMPLAVLVGIVGLASFVNPQEVEDWMKMGVVTVFVPLMIGLQAAGVFSTEDEPALEIAMAAPRPLAWLVVERLAAAAAAYTLIALLGAAVLLARQQGAPAWEEELPSPLAMAVTLFSWAAPALFLAGVGVFVSIRTRMPVFGMLVVLMLWIAFALFGRFFLPGVPLPFPINLIQPFLWPIHILATPADLVPSDFWLNRLFLSCAGIGLVLLAVRTLADSENLLLNARSRKHPGAADAAAGDAPRRIGKAALTPLPVRPQALAQIVGIARCEFRMAWRQRMMKVFVLSPIMLFLVGVIFNLLELMVPSAILSLLPPEQIQVIYAEQLVGASASFVLPLVLWVWPLLVAGQVPSDTRMGTAELLRALPMHDSAYLAGKVLGIALAGGSALVLTAVVYAGVWFLRIGPFYAAPVLANFTLWLLLLALSTTLAVMLGATQSSGQRALALVVAVLYVPEFLQAVPLVQALLPGTTDFLTKSMFASMETMRFLPPLRRGFDPLGGSLGPLYGALFVKTALIALAAWAWRRVKSPAR